MPPRPIQRDLFDPRILPRVAAGRARTRAVEVAPGVRCLRALRRHGWVLVATLALSCAAAAGLERWLQPVYQASASVELQAPVPAVQFTPSGPASPDPDIDVQTVAEELGSRELVGEAAQQLGPGIESHVWRRRSGAGTSPEAWTAAAMRQVQVNPVEHSRIIKLQFQAPRPDLAARFLNQLIADDLALERTRAWSAAEGRVTALWQRSEAAGTQLAQAQAEVQQLQDRPGGPSPAGLALAQQRQQQLATAETAAAIASLQQADVLTAATPAATPPELEARRAELEGTIRRLAAQYQPAAAPLQQAEQELAGLDASLAAWQQQGRQAVAGALAAERGLDRDLTAALARESQTQLQIERGLNVYTLAQSRLQADRDTYGSLLDQLQQAAAEVGASAPPLRVVDPATPPAGALRPLWPETLAYAAVLGLLVGTAVLWGIEQLRCPVYLPEAGEMGIPLMTVLPSPAAGLERGLEVLGAALMLAQAEAGTSTVLLTSAEGAEGKTTVAFGLARHLSRAGLEVLLLDAHPQRPGVHRLLGGDAGPGLRELLAGQARVEEVLRRGSQAGPATGPQTDLCFIAAGAEPAPAVPGYLLSLATGAAEEVLTAARQRYAWVVIDGPPILSGAEASLWARLSDCTLVVAAEGCGSRRRLRRGLDLLETAGASQLGLILNRASKGQMAVARTLTTQSEAAPMEMRQRA